MRDKDNARPADFYIGSGFYESPLRNYRCQIVAWHIVELCQQADDWVWFTFEQYQKFDDGKVEFNRAEAIAEMATIGELACQGLLICDNIRYCVTDKFVQVLSGYITERQSAMSAA